MKVKETLLIKKANLSLLSPSGQSVPVHLFDQGITGGVFSSFWGNPHLAGVKSILFYCNSRSISLEVDMSTGLLVRNEMYSVIILLKV